MVVVVVNEWYIFIGIQLLTFFHVVAPASQQNSCYCNEKNRFPFHILLLSFLQFVNLVLQVNDITRQFLNFLQ